MAQDRPDLKPLVGKQLTVIAWIWARTVKSPNPAYSHVDVPLASTFMLATKPGKEAFVEPKINKDEYHFTVRTGRPRNADAAKNGTKAGRGSNFRCLISQAPISGDYIKTECNAGRLQTRLMAIVGQGSRERIYLSPTKEHETAARSACPQWAPEGENPPQLTGGGAQAHRYGLKTWASIFTPRQLLALTSFSELAQEAREVIKRDIHCARQSQGRETAECFLDQDRVYGEAVGVYLACGISRSADFWSSLCIWANQPKNELVTHLFGRQAIPMAWDFGEANPFSDSGGNFSKNLSYVAMGIDFLAGSASGHAVQADAASGGIVTGSVVSTDPPYYDNIPYADLSDFFYVWLRRTLRDVYPDLFATIAVPKAEELVALPYRHPNGKEGAEQFFLEGMTRAMRSLAKRSHPAFPVTIYYAFKQAESDSEGTTSTGWDTFLGAVIDSGLALSGTWPMRTERQGRMIANDTNSLASSIVLVCRKRSPTAETISRRQFIRELNATLPQALDAMTRKSEGEHSPVAPVDLSQAIIGPGMAVFSKYAAVLEADGSPMTVRTALQLINRFLAEDDFDADTQFCLHWFEQYGWENGKFGEADTLARAKGTSVDGVKNSGVLQSAGGNVRLLKWADYKPDWDPAADDRLPVWEGLHQLVRVFKTDGESAAGKVLSAVAAKAEPIRQLAYRLYTLCERAGRAEDARAYNELITSWAPIESAAAQVPSSAPAQKTLFE